ncbi:MAG: cytochrome c [Candidatus Pristimantibacillus sp.]
MPNSSNSIVLKACLFIAIAAVILSGCGSNNSNSSTSNGQKQTTHMDAPAKTAKVYKANCVSCHGSDLQGRIGPTTNLQQVGSRMSEQEIVQQIQYGDESMQGFKDRLTEEEIAGLAAWLAGKQE